jgi:hypothetical protein
MVIGARIVFTRGASYRRGRRESPGISAKSAVFTPALTLCRVKALVVGHADPAAVLTSALNDRGVEAELHALPRAQAGRAVIELAAALTELETRLEEDRPTLTVAVGLGDAPLALAVTASKLRIPLVAWIDDPDAPGDELERAEQRILRTLADLDAGAIGDGAAAIAAADRIASWADLNLAA